MSENERENMKFKNPLDYVKDIINKFKELINYPYKRKIYSYILILVFLLSIPSLIACFIGAYTSVPSESDKKVITGTITKLNCYPVGFKHGPHCKVKVDNHSFANDFVDGYIENQKAYIRDLFNTAYNDKKCIYIKYYNSLIYELKYCDGKILYLLDDLKELYSQRKIFTIIGIFSLICAILSFLLLNKEFKKENQIF